MKKEHFFKRILAILFCALLVFAVFLPAYAAPETQGYYFYRPMPVEDFEKLEDFING